MKNKLEMEWLRKNSLYLEKSFIQTFKHMAQTYKLKHNISNVEKVYKLLGIRKQYLSYWEQHANSLRFKESHYELIENAAKLFILNDIEKEKLANRAGISMYKIDNFNKYFKTFMEIKKIKGKKLYEQALVSERMYHYICAGKHITKYTLISLGIILNLNYLELNELLMKAGYTFSNSIAYDVIVSYIIKNSNLKGVKLLDYINDTLYTLNLPLLMTRGYL